MSIEEFVDGKLREIASTYAIEYDGVKDVYCSTLSAMVKENPGLVEPEKSALFKTRKHYYMKYGRVDEPKERTFDAKLCEIEGFLAGVGEFRDRKGEMKATIKRYIEKNGRVNAEKMGYIDTTGAPLDYRENTFGRANKTFGELLEKVDVNSEMILYGIFRRLGDEAFSFTTLKTGNSTIAESWNKYLKFPLDAYKPFKTWANVKDDPAGLIATASMREGSMTLFTPDDKPVYKIHEAVMNTVEGNLWTFDELPEHLITNNRNYNRVVFMKGIIDDIRPDYKNWKGVPARLYDDEDVAKSTKIFLPEGYDAQFGGGTKAIVFGKDFEIMSQNESDGKWNVPTGKIEVRCYGVYPLPGTVIKPVEYREAGKTKLTLFNPWSKTK